MHQPAGGSGIPPPNMDNEQHKTLYWFLDYGLDIVVTLCVIAICVSWFVLVWRATKALQGLQSSFDAIANSLAKYLNSLLK